MSEARSGIRPASRKTDGDSQPQIVGWKEFVDLPELGLSRLQAKMDTGAKTSALHVDAVEQFLDADGATWVRFRMGRVSPTNRNPAPPLTAPLIDTRVVRSSNGEAELRCVIRTVLSIGSNSHRVEITLTNRKAMRYPILVGRTALRTGFLVNPGRSFLLSRNPDSTASRPRKEPNP